MPRRVEAKMERVTVLLEPDTMTALRRAAEADDMSLGSVARAALARGLPAELERRRKRRAREAGQGNGK